MKKHIGLAAVLMLAACGMALAEDWESFDSRDTIIIATDAYMGYGWASMTYWNGAPWTPGLNFDGVTNCINFSLAFLPRLGPFHVGPRLEVFSSTYITGFIKDYSGVEHDQAVIELCLDAYIGYTGVEWLSAYAFAGVALPYYAVFDPLHPNGGSDEYCFGVRGGAGISFIPLSIELWGGRLRIGAGPEVIYGLIFPTDLLYPYLRVHGRITVHYAMVL